MFDNQRPLAAKQKNWTIQELELKDNYTKSLHTRFIT